MKKTIENYLSLAYTRELIPDPVVGWGVRIKELPGCMSQGQTAEEAMRMIEDAMRGWIEAELEAGNPIPEPKNDVDYSGKFVLRLPKTLHRQLAETAEEEEVSLNQLIVYLLAEGVSQRNSAQILSQAQAILKQVTKPMKQEHGYSVNEQ